MCHNFVWDAVIVLSHKSTCGIWLYNGICHVSSWKYLAVPNSCGLVSGEKVDDAKDDACPGKAYKTQPFELRPQWCACINLPCWNVWSKGLSSVCLCMRVWTVQCLCLWVHFWAVFSAMQVSPVGKTLSCAKSKYWTQTHQWSFCFVWHFGLDWFSAHVCLAPHTITCYKLYTMCTFTF